MEQNMDIVKKIEYRKEKLMEQAKRIETLLSGKCVRYDSFIVDETGHYSEEKVWELIEELIVVFKKYDRYYLEVEDLWEDEDIEDFVLTEEDIEFVKCFLYCVIRWGYSGYGIADNNVGKCTFQDFIDMKNGIGRVSNFKEEDLLYQEKYEIIWNDPFHTFNDLYVHLMHQPAYLSAKENVMKSMMEKYATQIEETERNWAEYEVQLNEVSEDVPDFFDEEDEMSRLQDEILRMDDEAIALFENKEEYAKQYLLFRELYFKRDGYLLNRFGYIIDGMLDVFLYQKGVSRFLEDELFFKTFAMLRKTAGYVQEYASGEVK